MIDRLIRRNEVEKLTGIPRSTLYHMMDRGEFPRPLKIGARSVAWVSSDVERWIESRKHARIGSKEPVEGVTLPTAPWENEP